MLIFSVKMCILDIPEYIHKSYSVTTNIKLKNIVCESHVQ